MSDDATVSEPQESVPDNATAADAVENRSDETRSEEKSSDAKLTEILNAWDDGSESDDTELQSLRMELDAARDENGRLSEQIELSESREKVFDENLARIDRHDLNRAAEKIAHDTGLSQTAAERELMLKLIEDADFAAAAEHRFDSPDEFKLALENVSDELFEKYPPPENVRAVANGYRLARSEVRARNIDHGYPSSAELAGMNAHDFQHASERVFGDVRSGKLKPSKRRSGAIFTTNPQ